MRATKGPKATKYVLEPPPVFSSDPGFAERAAKFSSFSNGGNYYSLTPYALAPDHRCKPRGSRSIAAGDNNNNDGKLSRSSSCSRLANLAPSSCITTAAADGDEIKAKRQRSWESTKEDVKLRPDRACSESYSGGDSSPLSMKESCKPSELPKQDYIHVRARRGQATDSHSLAERVRREKIGERMKFLQDLVPGCNKVTGKAMMLDEIINYVQSLQRQVEFLSMKLASVNPRLDFDVENFLAKEQMQSHASTTMMMGPNPTAMLYGHHQQPQQHQMHNLQSFEPSGLDFTPAKSASEACIRRTMSAPVAAPWFCSDAFADNLSQLSSKWEGELQSVVHTGFLQGKPNAWLPQEVHCQIPASHMKLEL
ncbi:unnamed protein product [Sphagnum jensenii]|uniref:BHLH domain-containing protein n=1 Tax=Sphagnum jensenii TaxID=128206 RepID=A0ABP0VRH8_9BRYO